jgi:transposase
LDGRTQAVRFLRQNMPGILEDAHNGMPDVSGELFARLVGHFRKLDRQMKELELHIKEWHRQSTAICSSAPSGVAIRPTSG